MSEMDMDIKHGALEDANAQMKQVAATMNSALDTIVQRLDAIRSEFSGEAAKEFAEFKQAVNNLDSSLSQQFDQGANLLADAHGIIRNGDRKSAYLFQR
ncbi:MULTISPECIES: WXG100 family type VII secretion target [Streptomycetaceae]|uniref:WXG100 family type VII secretion target n=1 Tax=unclassified Streptomyces TaxID=2593676 RepID=UPI00337E454B